MAVLKKMGNLLLFFLLFLFLLVLFLDTFQPIQFSEYLFSLEHIELETRFGDLLDKKIEHVAKIRYSHGISKDWSFAKDDETAIIKLESGEIDAYFLELKSAKLWVKETPNLTITGENIIWKNYAFLVIKDLYTKKISRNPWADFFIILKNYSTGNFGMTKDRIHMVNEKVLEAIPTTFYLIIFTSFTITLFSILFSFLLSNNSHPFRNKILSGFLELFSSIPGFLIAFSFLIIFSYSRNVPDWMRFYSDSIKYFNREDPILGWRLIKYFSLPVITLSFANGTISVLSKLLVEKIENYHNSEGYKFFLANGMKSLYLDYTMKLKTCLPVIFNFIAMKIPLIIGSSVIIEKVFDMKGVGNLAYTYFSRIDIGMILTVFCLIYSFAFFFDLLMSGINIYLQPIQRKEN